MNLGWEPRDDKQTMYFVFAIKTKHMSVSCGNGKITRKEMSKLFSCGYDRYDMVKCHGNVNFEEIDTESSTGKNDGLLLLWGIFKKYIKQKYYDESDKKRKFSFSWHLQIYKTSMM